MRGLRKWHGIRAAGLAVGLVLGLVGAMLAPARASVPAPDAADPASLSMTASVSPSPLVIGGSAVYTVTVSNTGTMSATASRASQQSPGRRPPMSRLSRKARQRRPRAGPSDTRSP